MLVTLALTQLFLLFHTVKMMMVGLVVNMEKLYEIHLLSMCWVFILEVYVLPQVCLTEFRHLATFLCYEVDLKSFCSSWVNFKWPLINVFSMYTEFFSSSKVSFHKWNRDSWKTHILEENKGEHTADPPLSTTYILHAQPMSEIKTACAVLFPVPVRPWYGDICKKKKKKPK